jgi:hypothetical protein
MMESPRFRPRLSHRILVFALCVARVAALEPRISEVMAENSNGLSDEDGQEVDWLEIHNLNPVAQDLTGWYLTDDPGQLTKWQFPGVSINANGYLVVFASGKDRRVSGQNLHTSFRLRAAGETLALVNPDGTTIVSQITFGQQQPDVSYGLSAVTAATETLIPANAPARALVPPNNLLGVTWTLPGFVDSAWQSGFLAAGYENSTGYQSLLGLDVKAAMLNTNPSCYIRVPFTVASLADALSLALRMRYDDGFAVYLNGTLLPTTGRNAPATLTWNSAAAADHPDAEAVLYEDIPITQHLGLLTTGMNVLAIHGMNAGSTSSDFLIGPQLVLTRGTFSEGFMPVPTPGAPNSSGVLGFVKDTKFSVDRGFHTAPFEVTITCDTPGAVIRYTRNGDTPTATSGFVYSAPVEISSTTVLRAAAFLDGYQPSNVDTHSYLFPDDIIVQSANGAAPPGWPTGSVNGQRFNYGMDPDVVNGAATPAIIKSALQAIPSISIVTDQPNLTDAATGIYTSPQSRGEDVERPVSMEIINDPLNPGPGGFQQDAGLRIRGGFSRDPNNPKHSFRIFFRSAYGKGKMDYPLFGDATPTKFDGFDLRTSQDASWAYLGSGENTFLRDEVSRATQLLISPGSRIRYLHVYLNGQYWGLYNTDERPNKGYGEQYFGGKEDDFDVVKTSGYPGGHTTEASDGTMAAGSGWHQLWTGTRAVRSNPSNANYFKLMGLAADGATPTADPVVLDAVNLADYLLVLFYMGGNDGPVSDYVGASNNWFGVRDRTGTVGFRYFIHDFEQSLGLESGNNQRVGSGTLLRPWSNTVAGVNDYARSNPEFMHEDLAWNLEYRTLFGDRAHRHFFNNGVMTDANVLARMNALAAMIDTAIWGESARWGDSVRTTPFVRNDWLAANNRLFNFIRFGTNGASGPGRVAELLRQLRGYDAGTKPLYPLVNAPVFSQHGGGIPAAGTGISMSQSNTGTTTLYYTTNGADPRMVGGGVSPAAQVYSAPVLLDAWTITVKARVLRGTDWSALNEAVFARSSSPPPLILTEIHSTPAPPSAAEIAAGFDDKEDFEFIELMNSGTEPLNLRDIRFARGVDFTFPDITLAAGERAVVVRNLAAFRHRYGGAPRVLGTFALSLEDNGERVALTSALGATITDFSYDTTDPWPTGAAGTSLVLRHPSVDAASPLSWRTSLVAGGSPSAAEGTTYTAWKSANSVKSESADTDQDGLVPLLEYVSGGSPVIPDTSRLPFIEMVSDSLIMTYWHSRAADDAIATVMQSSNLFAWTPALTEPVAITDEGEGLERVTLRISALAGSRVFLAVHWQTQP